MINTPYSQDSTPKTSNLRLFQARVQEENRVFYIWSLFPTSLQYFFDLTPKLPLQRHRLSILAFVQALSRPEHIIVIIVSVLAVAVHATAINILIKSEASITASMQRPRRSLGRCG